MLVKLPRMHTLYTCHTHTHKSIYTTKKAYKTVKQAVKAKKKSKNQFSFVTYIHILTVKTNLINSE